MTTIDRERDPAAAPADPRSALARWFDPAEPRPARGPFTRWPRAADAVLALFVFAATLSSVALSRLDDADTLSAGSVRDLGPGVFALAAFASVALWWRRARPVSVTAVVLLTMVVWALAGYGDGNDLALVVATYSVGRYGRDRRHDVAVVVAAVTVSGLGSVVDTNQRVDLLPVVLVAALPWYVGRRIRHRGDYLALLRDRSERLAAEQHVRAREAVAAERSRIARELHDVVAHQVSMMTVQAGAAKTIARHDLDTAVQAMGDVERAGRETLGELRHLLGVLRRDGADSQDPRGSGPLDPQRGLADIAALVDELERTGADVTCTVNEFPGGLSAALDLSAYRIVQESCTNIIRHAGPHPTVDIGVERDGDAVVIDIVNSVASVGGTAPALDTASGLPVSGYGIAGMRERVTVLGGTLTVGPHPPAHYRVTARLPIEPEPT